MSQPQQIDPLLLSNLWLSDEIKISYGMSIQFTTKNEQQSGLQQNKLDGINA